MEGRSKAQRVVAVRVAHVQQNPDNPKPLTHFLEGTGLVHRDLAHYRDRNTTTVQAALDVNRKAAARLAKEKRKAAAAASSSSASSSASSSSASSATVKATRTKREAYKASFEEAQTLLASGMLPQKVLKALRTSTAPTPWASPPCTS